MNKGNVIAGLQREYQDWHELLHQIGGLHKDIE